MCVCVDQKRRSSHTEPSIGRFTRARYPPIFRLAFYLTSALFWPLRCPLVINHTKSKFHGNKCNPLWLVGFVLFFFFLIKVHFSQVMVMRISYPLDRKSSGKPVGGAALFVESKIIISYPKENMVKLLLTFFNFFKKS